MANCHGTGRWLTENQYRRIKRKGKSLGAEYVDTSSIWHTARFEHVSVSFAFRPFEFHASMYCENFWNGSFSDKTGAECVKASIDKALEFIEYLKAFNSEVEDDTF